MSMDGVPTKIQPPEGIELRVSKVDRRRIGCFSLTPINKGSEFGPYEGRIVYDKDDETVDSKFSWEVFDLKTFKYVHTVDATNPEDGNWMRYVCCARYFEEQNIVSTQNGPEVYYRALKDIGEGEELLTWFQPKKKRRKKSLLRNSIDSADIQDLSDAQSAPQANLLDNPSHSHNKQKRRRKPKVIPDAYIGPLDWEDPETPARKVREDVFEPLQPGQKRRRRKKLSSDNVSSEAASPSGGSQEIEEGAELVKPNIIKIEDKEFEKKGTDEEKLSKINKQSESNGSTVRKNSSSGDSKKESGQALSIAEINNSVEWEFPKPGEDYIFELKRHHIVTEKGKKLYKCDICLGLYKHMFSLKRHYLRNHVNYKYLSKSDMTNCLINLAQVKHLMRKKFPEEIDCTSDERQKINEVVINENLDSTEVRKNETTEKDDTVCDETSQNGVQETEVCSQQSKDDTADSKHGPSCDEEKNEEESNGTEKETVSEGVDESSLKDVNNEDSESSTGLAQLENVDSYVQESDSVAYMKDGLKLAENESNKGSVTEAEKVHVKANKAKEEASTNVSMPGLFRCYTCYLTFDDFESIREHTQNHPEQMDGACFPCDLCSMRFNYKHNLVRHKKTHETEEDGKKMSADVNGTLENNDRLSPKKHLLPLKNQSPPEKKPLLLPSVFRCGICPQKFDIQAKVIKHVEEEHKTGSKFQCMYCGKEFQSMPNMKKHVRFHLGYRATCRICSEAFSNVGALRKHTRVSHPDIYKAKLIERLEKYGVLKGPDKNALSKDIIEKVNLGRKQLIETKEAANPEKNIKEEVKVDASAKKLEKDEEIDHEINFTADEIDDGGSRFKFACTVCKKRFSSYINMCRHRRKVHSNENRNRTEQCLTFGRKPRNNPSPVLENPAEIAAFYANISHNIAANLNCYIDGKPESLKTFVDHIKVEGYTGNFGYNAENDKPLDLTWEKYNFPHDYKPVETISFADIKNVLNIHNDFDSHCMSVDAYKEIKKQKDIQNRTGDEKDINSDGGSFKYLKETEENTDKHIKDRVTEESVEDIEVREINSAWQSKEIKSCEKSENISKVVESDNMGKSSHGLKALANLGSVLSKKGSSGATCERNMEEVGGLYKFKVTDSVLTSTYSPAAKTFYQVKLGEYANFQDDLLSCDIDCTVAKETQIVSSKQCLKTGKCYEESEESSKNQFRETETLVKEAHDQLEALYDCIDNCEPVTKVYTVSPKSLSALCEKVLGLGPLTKEIKTGSTLNFEVAMQLKHSINDTKDQNKKAFSDTGPDYSDAPEESPFYNYETIVFGKNGRVEQVCAICKKHFPDFDALLRHHTKRHPATECSFLEVEQGHEIEDLHFSEPSHVGVLAITDPGLDNMSEFESFKCTNCDASFKSVTKLHVHIVNCSSIDPIYGAQKADNSPTKTPLKKKLQKKIFSMFGNKTGEKTDLNFTRFSLSQQRNETQSPKRVFTGCRKRTSVILPDSPQKLVCEQKLSVPTVSGYNPQNHVRRRELTEILDTLTCEACGLKFKTIIILERHIKYCTKKEKFKSIQPMACPLMDESLEKIKNMCFYCSKNFTYTKSLLNHFQDFCPIKRARLDKGELTEQDRVKEKEIIERIQKADEEKALKQKEIENRPKRSMTWQVGRKSKRKGHAWTNIKKRSQPKQSPSGVEITEGSEENEVFESSGSESEIEEGSVNASNTDIQNGSSELKENLNSYVSDVPKSSQSDIAGNVVTKTCENSENMKNSCYEVLENAQTAFSDNETLDSDTKLTMDSYSVICENETRVSLSTAHEVIPASEIKTAVSTQNDVMSSVEVTSGTDQSFSENDEHLKLDTDVNNTSLNCTTRYNVNQVKAITKYRPIAPKPKASSVIFQCVSKKIPISKQLSSENKKDSGNSNKSTYKISNEIECSSTCIPKESVSSSMPVHAKGEATFQLAQQGLVTGKRKRARVGKVEEFLRNAFKRKRKKVENDSEKSSGQMCSSFIILNPILPGANNTVPSKENVDSFSEKSKQNDENILNDTLNEKQPEKNQPEKRETADISTRPSKEIFNKTAEQNEKSDIGHKCGSDIGEAESSRIPQTSVTTKRGRGRPRGSFTKKPDQNVTKNVQGRKRGRPRKIQLKEPSTNQGEYVETCPPDNPVDHIVEGEENTASYMHIMQSKGNIMEESVGKHPVNVTESISCSDTDEIHKMSNCETKGEINENLNPQKNTYLINSNINENSGNIIGSGTKESLIGSTNLDFAGNNEVSYQFLMHQGRDKYESCSETAGVDTGTAKESIDSTIQDVKKVGLFSDSFVTQTSIDTNLGESHAKPVTHANRIAETDLESKYSSKRDGENFIERHTLNENFSGISNGSYDEVDGFFSPNTSKEGESQNTCYVINKQISDTIEMSHNYIQKHAEILSSPQATDHPTDTRMKDQVLHLKDYWHRIEENFSAITEVKDKAKKPEGKGVMDNASLNDDKTVGAIQIVQESSFDSSSNEYPADKDKCQSFNVKNDWHKESDPGLGESENIGNMSNDPKTAEVESTSFRNESKALECNENNLFEPVLSPSERVKMNKRSCKKDVDLTSQVWVKRTQLNKTKVEKKIEMFSESTSSQKAEHMAQVSSEKDQGLSMKNLKADGKSDSLPTDSSYLRGTKRKVSESDSTPMLTSQVSKQENVKGSVKRLQKSKKNDV